MGRMPKHWVNSPYNLKSLFNAVYPILKRMYDQLSSVRSQILRRNNEVNIRKLTIKNSRREYIDLY